jgi:selT/selW/selH-like putative selenoprotein
LRISIEYCGTCNYRPIAAALSLAIQEEFGIKPLLVHSTKIGAFEVTADGETIFSKSATGVFPSHEEIVVKMHELNILNQTKREDHANKIHGHEETTSGRTKP